MDVMRLGFDDPELEEQFAASQFRQGFVPLVGFLIASIILCIVLSLIVTPLTGLLNAVAPMLLCVIALLFWLHSWKDARRAQFVAMLILCALGPVQAAMVLLIGRAPGGVPESYLTIPILGRVLNTFLLRIFVCATGSMRVASYSIEFSLLNHASSITSLAKSMEMAIMLAAVGFGELIGFAMETQMRESFRRLEDQRKALGATSARTAELERMLEGRSDSADNSSSAEKEGTETEAADKERATRGDSQDAQSIAVLKAGVVEGAVLYANFKQEYTREAVVGRGATSTAVLMKSRRTGELVVCKEIDVTGMSAHQLRNCEAELWSLNTVRHPHIIRFISALHHRSAVCILTEYAARGTLADLISRQAEAEQPFELAQVVRWMSQLGQALQHVHSLRILHRDVKTRNVFAMESGDVKLGDFGLSRVLHTTLAHTQCGTPYYLSPEAARGEGYAVPADAWGVGVILFELLTLTRPFKAGNLAHLISRIVTGNYDKEALEASPHPEVLKQLASSRGLLHSDSSQRTELAGFLLALESASLSHHVEPPLGEQGGENDGLRSPSFCSLLVGNPQPSDSSASTASPSSTTGSAIMGARVFDVLDGTGTATAPPSLE